MRRKGRMKGGRRTASAFACCTKQGERKDMKMGVCDTEKAVGKHVVLRVKQKRPEKSKCQDPTILPIHLAMREMLRPLPEGSHRSFQACPFQALLHWPSRQTLFVLSWFILVLSLLFLSTTHISRPAACLHGTQDSQPCSSLSLRPADENKQQWTKTAHSVLTSKRWSSGVPADPESSSSPEDLELNHLENVM